MARLATDAAVKCSACGAALDASGMFPGGNVRCACGVETRVPGGHEAARVPDVGSPYRQSQPSVRVAEAGMLTCPFCGGPCVSDARQCPHCDVELASVRCPHCYALHFTGARFCTRCKTELELEPTLDATDAPCPRCDKTLSAPGGELHDMHECKGCGGIFLSPRALAAITSREDDSARRSGLHATAPHASPSAPDVVQYVKCPLCHVRMNRVNFGQRSGVIVDVCRPHGTWFDAGELTRAIEFIARGGLDATLPAARYGSPDAGHADPKEAEKAKERTVMAAEMHAALVKESYEETRSIGRWAGRSTNILDLLFELLR